ncbi:uncharacterized protein LOC131215233 [Anopheles bellator]|uniref:uncharacterized protein LOC131215233 n=1 Tax=Anopheles bellator TaxID=139047 RepID=UPI0026482B9E|nr:uncharacterized protein LOC131215233 [Anopheles bellator]
MQNSTSEALVPAKAQFWDLPDEILGIVFDNLDVYELKTISLVCKRWCKVVFCGSRMDKVCITVRCDINDQYYKLLLKTTRIYRHIDLSPGSERMVFDDFIQFLRKSKNSVHSLKICPTFHVTLNQLRLIVLEVPNLQQLSIHTIAPYANFEQMNERHESFPSLPKLTHLCIGKESSVLPFDEFSVRTIAFHLKCLDMHCDSQDQLKVFRHFSGQLKFVRVVFATKDFFDRFFELIFPDLNELEILDNCYEKKPDGEFFRSLTSLRRLTLRCHLSKRTIQIITSCCHELTFLHIHTQMLEEKWLTSLAELTKLQAVKLEGWFPKETFYGCKSITSLESLHLLDGVYMFRYIPKDLNFFNDILTVAPQLSLLEIGCPLSDDSLLLFICDKFKHLRCLKLRFRFGITTEGLIRIDQLPLLQELQLGPWDVSVDSRNVFVRIPSNNVQRLSLVESTDLTDDDLLMIPEIFPKLQNLCVARCRSISEAVVARLRTLRLTCRIDMNGKRFYPDHQSITE